MLVKLRSLKIFLIILATIYFNCKENEDEKSLLLYCAASVKPVVEKVARQYYEEYGVRIHLQYGGSGTLLSNLRVAKQGDLYLAADKSYINQAIAFSILKETQPLAFIKPVIAVAKENPKKINTVKDLFSENIKVAIANPNAASIGRLTKKIFEQLGQWEILKNNISVLMPTVSKVANTIKLGTIDAGIVWDATANQYENLDIVNVPQFNSFVENITIGVLSYSKQSTEALKFLRYLSAKNKGLTVFNEFFYQPIDGDMWNEKPKYNETLVENAN